MKTKIGNIEVMKSQMPPIEYGRTVRSIVKPHITKSPDNEAIPWPKIEGSLPIDSPTSVSPRPMSRNRSKSVYKPVIVEYKKKVPKLAPLELKKIPNQIQAPKVSKAPEQKGSAPETIVLKIPDSSSSDEKRENSESEETQKQDTVRELEEFKSAELNKSSNAVRPKTKERSSRKLEYVKHLFLDK